MLATIAVPRAHTPGRPRQRPDRLIADNHPNATYQDGRKLRRYRHRWIAAPSAGSWCATSGCCSPMK